MNTKGEVVNIETYTVVPVKPIGLNAIQAAKFIGVSLSVLYKLEEAGIITSLKLKRRKIFSVNKLTSFVEGGGDFQVYGN